MGKKNYEYRAFSGGTWWVYCDDSADGQGLSKHDGLQLRISCHYGSDLSGGIIRRGVPSGWYYTGIFKRDARTYQCF